MIDHKGGEKPRPTVFTFLRKNGTPHAGTLSRRELFPALGTTARKHLPAVACSHSFAEAMLLGTLALFRLVCSEHLPDSSLYYLKAKNL